MRDFDVFDVKKDLFDTIADIVNKYRDVFAPQFDATDDSAVQVWGTIRDLSNVLNNVGIELNLRDARKYEEYAGILNDNTVLVDVDDYELSEKWI